MERKSRLGRAVFFGQIEKRSNFRIHDPDTGHGHIRVLSVRTGVGRITQEISRKVWREMAVIFDIRLWLRRDNASVEENLKDARILWVSLPHCRSAFAFLARATDRAEINWVELVELVVHVLLVAEPPPFFIGSVQVKAEALTGEGRGSEFRNDGKNKACRGSHKKITPCDEHSHPLFFWKVHPNCTLGLFRLQESGRLTSVSFPCTVATAKNQCERRLSHVVA